MAQLAIIFICWRRKHYNKSTLSFLSDCAYQCKYLPAYWSKKASILKLITEKKVEVWHSVLRRNTEKFEDAKSIEDTAKSLASSGFLSEFVQSFVPQYHHGQQSESNLWLIAGKSAEFLLDLFKSISQNCHKSYQVTILKIKKIHKINKYRSLNHLLYHHKTIREFDDARKIEKHKLQASIFHISKVLSNS